MENEKEFVKGFNDGYLMAKHEPELYSTITKEAEVHNDYFNGFVSGGKEHGKEKDVTNHIQTKESKEHGKDIEKER